MTKVEILALDVATTTGFALRCGGRIESGTVNFAPKRGESSGMRFVRFRVWLTEMIRTHAPRFVAFERAHMRGGAATEVLVGMQTRVQEIAAEFGLEYVTVETNVLKKFATGKGTADKAAMMATVTPHLGRTPVDDNEADAVWVLLWAERECGVALT